MIGKQVVFINEDGYSRPHLKTGVVVSYVGKSKDKVEVQHMSTSYTFNRSTGCHDIPEDRVSESWCYLDQVYVV